MTKSELINVVALWNILPSADVAPIVNTVFDVIRDELVAEREVNLPGFGKFSVRHRAARVGHNPRTAEDITIPAHKYPYFKPGKSLKQAVNHD